MPDTTLAIAAKSKPASLKDHNLVSELVAEGVRFEKRPAKTPDGAVVGGLAVGLLESFGAGYISSSYKDAIAFLVILLVLFVMPQGLFGRAGVERV